MSGEAHQASTPIESAEFRRVLGHYATGVTVVTSQDPDGGVFGLTANSVSSVSLDPPLVLVCVDRTADTYQAIERSEAFAISVLGEGGERLARRFADDPTETKFEGVAYREEVTGAPVLRDALAWIDCRLWAAYDGGDHTIFVGRVVATDARDGAPLLYFRGGYGRLSP
ncbi:MAG: flavin reductase family protein [Gemmatimonadota bacterium]|jgi:flavin reductase (DIM6/NTAB) family NADH-FMN oxidoreductase RutF